MKALTFVLTAALLASPAYAETQEKKLAAIKWGDPLRTYSKEEHEVDKVFAEWREALSSGKAEKVVKLYDDDAILLATLAAKPITTQQERMDYFATLTAKPKMAATVDEEYVKLLDPNSALVSGVYTFSFEENGKTVKIPARYTFVFEKQNGRWLIEEHHSSKVPE
jgi:uncharacterized protein (TIGR02246 family)